MKKMMLCLIVLIEFSACDEAATSKTTNSLGADSTQMILDSTNKIDSLNGSMDTIRTRP